MFAVVYVLTKTVVIQPLRLYRLVTMLIVRCSLLLFTMSSLLAINYTQHKERASRDWL